MEITWKYKLWARGIRLAPNKRELLMPKHVQSILDNDKGRTKKRKLFSSIFSRIHRLNCNLKLSTL